jgi:outer membrane protein assembly factor BamB
VWLDHGGLVRFLPAGRSADLVVLTDLAADELTDALAGEVRRVLHPWFGLAVLGDASGKLSETALRNWADSIFPGAAPLVAPGRLVTVRAPALPGADHWPQWWHASDNNAVSTDQAFHLPESVQWAGKPFFSTRIELPIVASGRLFVLWHGHVMDSSPGQPSLGGVAGEGPLLTACAAGSGVRLWARRLTPAGWSQASRSAMIADGNDLLVCDGGRIEVLDQATGRTRRTIETGCQEIRWLAASGGTVLVIGGAASQHHGHRSMKAVIPFRQGGRTLLALDRATFGVRWQVRRKAGDEALDPRSAAVAGGRVFTCTQAGLAEAHALADGKPLWRVETGVPRDEPRQYEWDRSSRHPVTGYAVGDLYIVSGTEQGQAVALGQSDGRKRWTYPTPQHTQLIPLAFEGLIWDSGKGLDPATGKVKRRLQGVRAGGCSRFTACPQGIIGNAGLTYNLWSEKPEELLSAKSACGPGQYVANGLIWKFPTPCVNCTEWRGFVARGPAESPPPPGARLIVSHAAEPTGRTPAGWTTHRGDPRRSAFSPARVCRRPEIAWTAGTAEPGGARSVPGSVLLDAEYAPAPPVVAGRTVLIGRADGAVEALALDDGRCLWRAWTGGRIYASPTVWCDRVFVGSADGLLYALALADGRELWRLRVAPQAGRIPLFEQLASRWPVLASPLVVDGRVYVTAGLLDAVDRVYALCADARGKVLWECSDWSPSGVDGMVSGAGQLCWDDGPVYHGAEAPLVRLAVADGACRAAVAQGFIKDLTRWDVRRWRTLQAFGHIYKSGKGQEVGSPGRGWLVYGGRRLFTDQVETGTWRNSLHLICPDDRGDGRLPILHAPEGSARMPAWDNQDIMFPVESRRARFTGLVLVRLADMQRAALTRMPDANTAQILAQNAKCANGQSIPPDQLRRPFDVLSDVPSRWRARFPYGWTPVACALAGDAVVAALRSHRQTAKLAAYERSDGRKRWEVQLPANVCHNGLALAADGRILTALTDGRATCVAEAKSAP